MTQRYNSQRNCTRQVAKTRVGRRDCHDTRFGFQSDASSNPANPDIANRPGLGR